MNLALDESEWSASCPVDTLSIHPNILHIMLAINSQTIYKYCIMKPKMKSIKI
jgi:hypothetical protein